jgi:LacI family transcriptional regulator
MSEKKGATVIDVALAAGVGASTVSRYVRGGQSVSAAVAARIEEAISRLGYEPNHLARGLRGGRTQTLGVLVPHVNNVFFGNAIRIIQVEAQRRGYTVMLLMHQEDARLQEEQLASLKRSRVDGIILVPAAETSADKVRRILEETPVIAFDRPLHSELDAITLDNRGAGQQATEHLLWHKHQQIVAVTAPYKLQPLQRRLKGHQEAMDAAGCNSETIVLHNPEQMGRELAATLRRKRSPATAILSLSYTLSIAILGSLRDHGIALGKVGFVGIDDLEFAQFVEPELTAVAQPTEQLAQLCVEQLMRRIEGNADRPVKTSLPGILKVRASCGCSLLKAGHGESHPRPNYGAF